MEPILNGATLPDGARAVVMEILKKVGVPHCTVTSVARTPHDQARIMYDNCAAPLPAALKKLYKTSIHRQLALYKESGDRVIRIFQTYAKKKSRDAVIALMEGEILAVGPENVSRHCCDSTASYWVLDIAPSSIPDDLEIPFIAACKKHKRVSKVLEPPTDPAIHLEIAK
jgi:hypothetical protein